MTIFFVSIIFAQLSSLEFNYINSPQVAGDSFEITIVAKTPTGDTFRYNFPGLLKTTRDDFWSYCEPQLVDFYQGVCRRKVRVTIADTLRLKCEASGVIGLSNQFVLHPNFPDRLLILCPGESIAPGSPEGKFSQPESQIAGRPFEVKVYLVDRWFNPVSFRQDRVYLQATDSFALLSSGNLINGRRVLPVTLRRAGTQRIIAYADSSTIRPDTSVSFDVFPGSFAQLVLLLPGEELLPGDTTTSVYQTPGKTGVPLRQYVKEPFSVRVLATDACYNRVYSGLDTVALASDFAMQCEPASAVFFDSAWFTVTFDSTGDNQNLWVTGRSFQSYRSKVNIEAKTKRIATIKPDTIRAGSTVTITATLYDANDKVIKGKYTHFAVIKGNGRLLDTVGLTDTAGTIKVQFVGSGAHTAEMDSIAIMADDFTEKIGIFIEGDETVLAGRILAFPNPFGYNRPLTEIQYLLPTSCDVTVAIYDPFGNPVLTKKYRQGEEGAKSGINKITWDGKNGRGEKVANGVYVLRVWGMVYTNKVYDKEHRIAVIW
ncbi:MAG: FlgD immunoglobulin-like domain containing protein [candidate division WOR-3 bacterium]